MIFQTSTSWPNIIQSLKCQRSIRKLGYINIAHPSFFKYSKWSVNIYPYINKNKIELATRLKFKTLSFATRWLWYFQIRVLNPHGNHSLKYGDNWSTASGCKGSIRLQRPKASGCKGLWHQVAKVASGCKRLWHRVAKVYVIRLQRWHQVAKVAS